MPAPIAHMPVFINETSTTSASPVRSRWNSAAEMPAGDRHRADGVAVRRRGHARDGVGVGGLRAHAAGAAVPVRDRVVAAGVAVGAARAVAVTRHVDDVRVVGADVVDVGLQLLAHARHLVGEEDVGDRGEPVEDVAAFVLVEVEREAELAPVGVLEDGRHLAGEHRHAGRRQAAGGVAAGDVLDLDDLGAPVAEDGRRGRARRCGRRGRGCGFPPSGGACSCGGPSGQRNRSQSNCARAGYAAAIQAVRMAPYP